MVVRLNYHGANDFYYGEVEARRHQLRLFDPHRLLLAAYRLTSSYGTRAWPAVTSWLLLIFATAGLLKLDGVSLDANSKNLGYWDAWRFSLDSPISFFRPQQAPLLSLVETIVAIGIRIASALLVALAAVAVSLDCSAAGA